jgi:ferric-dicitrate binding protein FerR (iron transport regulator)
MDCPSARSEIPALVQGELDDDARRAVEEHLLACPACANEARDLRALLQALRDASETLPGPSPAVWAAVERETATEAAPTSQPLPVISRTPFPFRALRHVAATAAVFLIAAAVLVLWPPPGARLTPVAAVTPCAGSGTAIAGVPVREEASDTLLLAGQPLAIRGPSGALLVTPSSARLTASAGTELRFTTPYELTLHHGEVLVEEGAPPGLAVVTPTVRVTPVGTRFLVAHDGSTSILVEEGTVRVSCGGRDIEVKAGHASSASSGAAPAPPVPAPDAADRLRLLQETALTHGLRLTARLDPPEAGSGPMTRRHLTARLEKIPGVGLPEVRVSTLAGGHAYLTCTIDGAGPAAAPGPVIPLDPARMTERGDVRRGVARITAASPYEIAGEVDVAGLLPPGGPAQVVISWVGRRPAEEPRAWAGQVASPPISIPGIADGR